jgi:broad specificity phosphatase PhoE
MTGHRSQRAARDDFRSRVHAVADLAESAESDVLLVSHAGLLAYLRAELVRRGFRGPKFGIAEDARLYIFQRSAPNDMLRVL